MHHSPKGLLFVWVTGIYKAYVSSRVLRRLQVLAAICYVLWVYPRLGIPQGLCVMGNPKAEAGGVAPALLPTLLIVWKL